MVRRTANRPPREGIILVVVVSLLALFAVIGLGFVMFAESAATASRLTREAQNVVDNRAEIDPEQVLNFTLGVLLYDKPDDATGVYSALRGHSFGRNMYGEAAPLTTPYGKINTNTVAFNGLGKLKTPEP